MELTEITAEMELPFGPPPIFPKIEDELREYIQCPQRLPIHKVENTQAYWPSKRDVLELLEYQLCPVGTTLKFDRDPITGCLSNMREVVLHGAVETVKNSMSMSRAPGPRSEGIQGNSSNFPFWPGGFDEPTVSSSVPEEDVCFSNNLRTLAKGFRAGVEFDKDNCTPLNKEVHDFAVPSTQENNTKKTNLMKVNLMAMVHEEERQLGLYTVPAVKMEEKVAEPDEPVNAEFSKLADNIKELSFDSWNMPVLKLRTNPNDNLQAEWAEQVDISAPINDFHKRVPKPALTFDYELDTFQKQAIIKLEEGCNVFVAAHTSAGKTTVAEYAIALSQRHRTRIIYTSPIKALSNQKYRDFKRNKAFDSIGLMTGDVQINQTANCLIMTTEILLTMLYHGAEIVRDLEYVIFDEVHYINNENRGHVWEETVILLPSTVNIVMLSATVPNPLVFANWVGGIKKRKMFVITTLKRPVPLEHYLYLGVDGKTRNDRMLIFDSSGTFLMNNWYLAKTQSDAKDSKTNNNKWNMRNPKLTFKQEKTMWEACVAHLKETEKMPVVVFTLSRNRCDMNADALTGVNLTTESEKNHIRSFFKHCKNRLAEIDRDLPQINRIESLLVRGIGVHHSGILPIVKEIIELLFQNGMVKLLFATETFAIGINMPARTVIFDSLTKFDGKQCRELLPTEYIQMAGRAGRRGHDATGTVMIMCKNRVYHFNVLKPMMSGQSGGLESHFKINYKMVLYLRRVSESVTVEEMMRRSFKERRLIIDEKKHKYELERVNSELAMLPPLTDYQKELRTFYDKAFEYLTVRKELINYMFAMRAATKSLTPGRVLLISHRGHYNKLVMLFEVIMKDHNTSVKVLVLNNERDEDEENQKTDGKPDLWYEMMALSKTGMIFVPEDTSSLYHQCLTIPSHHVLEITNCLIKVDTELVVKNIEKRKIERFRDEPVSPTCMYAIRELLSLALMARQDDSILKPYVVYSFNDPKNKARYSYMTTLLEDFSLVSTRVSNFEEQFELVFRRVKLETERDDFQLKLRNEGLALYPEYIHRVSILKELGYLGTDDRVSLKGRVALGMGRQELLITELIYRNVLTNLEPAEIAALLSATVYSRGSNEDIPNIPALKEPCQTMKSVRAEIENMELMYNIEPLESLNFGVVNVVYEWARAKPFAKIMELTDIQEGIIVRCIQQLNDTLRDMMNAASMIGETVLREKLAEVSTAIKRDIVFTASLYTQD